MAQKQFDLIKSIAANEYFDDCYTLDKELKCWHKVHEPAERFEYEGFVIFAKKSEKEPTMLRFHDNLTGVFIGKYETKDAALAKLTTDYKKEVYTKKIVDVISEFGISPAYSSITTLSESL